jgi:RNA polymerase primary sigma factor
VKFSISSIFASGRVIYVYMNNFLQVTKKLVSLDMEIGRNTLQSGDGETLHGLVADQDGQSQPWNVVEQMLMKVDVDRLLNSQLGARERDIVRLHYGVGCHDGNRMSLETISHRPVFFFSLFVC